VPRSLEPSPEGGPRKTEMKKALVARFEGDARICVAYQKSNCEKGNCEEGDRACGLKLQGGASAVNFILQSSAGLRPRNRKTRGARPPDWDEADDRRMRPTAADYFSGPRDPVACALSRRGWDVRPVEFLR
jgi:hypothetical protein